MLFTALRNPSRAHLSIAPMKTKVKTKVHSCCVSELLVEELCLVTQCTIPVVWLHKNLLYVENECWSERMELGCVGERLVEELAPELVPMLQSIEMPANFVPVTNAVLAEMARRGIGRQQILTALRNMGSELPEESVEMIQVGCASCTLCEFSQSIRRFRHDPESWCCVASVSVCIICTNAEAVGVSRSVCVAVC